MKMKDGAREAFSGGRFALDAAVVIKVGSTSMEEGASRVRARDGCHNTQKWKARIWHTMDILEDRSSAFIQDSYPGQMRGTHGA